MTKIKPLGRSTLNSLYFIALLPGMEFQQKVKKIKENILESYGSGHALRSPAHITLYMPFKWREDRVDILERNLNDFASARLGFIIDLEDFGSFPKRVIYINVRESEVLNTLQKDLTKMAIQKLKLSNGQYKDMAFHPHMTVAFRDLKPAMYIQAWQEYKNKGIIHSFKARSLFLLKHNGKSWDVFREFAFQSE